MIPSQQALALQRSFGIVTNADLRTSPLQKDSTRNMVECQIGHAVSYLENAVAAVVQHGRGGVLAISDSAAGRCAIAGVVIVALYPCRPRKYM